MTTTIKVWLEDAEGPFVYEGDTITVNDGNYYTVVTVGSYKHYFRADIVERIHVEHEEENT